MLLQLDYPKTSNDIFDNIFRTDYAPKTNFYPLINIFESENFITVFAELPGVSKTDVQISFDKNILTISGEMKYFNNIDEKQKILLNEITSRKFNRSIKFENTISVENISAEMKDGILKIELPKNESEKPKQIEIK